MLYRNRPKTRYRSHTNFGIQARWGFQWAKRQSNLCLTCFRQTALFGASICHAQHAAVKSNSLQTRFQTSYLAHFYKIKKIVERTSKHNLQHGKLGATSNPSPGTQSQYVELQPYTRLWTAVLRHAPTPWGNTTLVLGMICGSACWHRVQNCWNQQGFRLPLGYQGAAQATVPHTLP